MTVPFIEENDQTRARHEHLDALRALVGNVYPNKFARSNVTKTPAGEDTITSIVAAFKKFEPQVKEGERPSADALESANAELNKVRVALAGRIAAQRRRRWRLRWLGAFRAARSRRLHRRRRLSVRHQNRRIVCAC